MSCAWGLAARMLNFSREPLCPRMPTARLLNRFKPHEAALASYGRPVLPVAKRLAKDTLGARVCLLRASASLKGMWLHPISKQLHIHSC